MASGNVAAGESIRGRILVAEDDETFRTFLCTILEDAGHEVHGAADGGRALQLLQKEQFDLVVSDLRMPGKSGLDVMREAAREPEPPQFIFLTAYGRIEEAVAAIKEGATDFLTKPLSDPDSLLDLVARTLKAQGRSREYLSLKELESAGLPPEEMIFAGAAMQQVRKLVHGVAETSSTVLITGESGTGKELVARAVHQLSPRRGQVFVPLNCAAITENLLESELFGHEKGAFTGALQTRQGKFELARGGTLFLDEIGEMSQALQAKLLRVLQERVFERVGGSRQIKADVRIVAATNRDLMAEVKERRFREDLYYRLNVFPLHLPPLRERSDAVATLADYFLKRLRRQCGRPGLSLDEQALRALQRYAWPGNVRELQNIMERAVILSRGSITVEDLPEALLERAPAPAAQDGLLRRHEQEVILAALREADNNRRLAAERLGISKRTLQYRLKEYGLVEKGSCTFQGIGPVAEDHRNQVKK